VAATIRVDLTFPTGAELLKKEQSYIRLNHAKTEPLRALLTSFGVVSFARRTQFGVRG
jgi:hypothetical protein